MDTVSYVSDTLDLEMNKVSMSPLVPMLGSFGELGSSFDFMPWLSADDDQSSLSYFPSMFTDEASFPPLTRNMATNVKTGTTSSYAAPLTNATSMLNCSMGDEFSDCLTSDTDSESGTQPNYTTFNEVTTTYFRCQTGSPAAVNNELSNYIMPTSADAVTPPPPPKRARLMSANSPSPTKAKVENKSSSKPKSTYTKNESPKPAKPSISNTCDAFSRGASHNIQLRTASRKPKTSRKGSLSSPTTNFQTPEERHARQSHNLVEKKYRNRLNTQFERLLAVLPADKQNGDEHNTERSGGENYDRRMSKAEVLDRARQRIKTLELSIVQLRSEREKLLESSRSFGLLPVGGRGV